MRILYSAALSIACCTVALAQSAVPLTFNVIDPTGSQAPAALPASYLLPTTAQGSSDAVFLDVVNNSSSNVYLVGAYVATSSTASTQNPNFSVSGSFSNLTLQPGYSAQMQVNFAPINSGSITGYFQIAYQIEQNGCTFGSSTTPCSNQTANISTFTGNATGANLVLSYLLSGGIVYVQPNNTIPISFGNVSLGGSQALTFTLSNQASESVAAPAISITSAGSAFQLDTSSLPASIAGDSFATFKVSFTPSANGVVNGTLTVGTNSYAVEASGVTPAGVPNLQISYASGSGSATTAQTTTPISFGQAVVGSASSLTFTVANPSSSATAVSVPSPSVNGTGFTLTGAPTPPFTIQPGASISFSLAFSGNSAGSYTGTLAIGTLSFSLTAQATGTLPPPFAFYVHDTTGKLPDTPLASIYQLASTAQGSSSALVLKVVNTSAYPVLFETAQVTDSAAATSQDANFTITNFIYDLTMPVGGSTLFTVNFSPLTTGTLTGYLRVGYVIQQNGCSFTSTNPATECPSGVVPVTTLVGTATAPILTLSYINSSGTQVALQPNASSPLSFGNLLLSATNTITFVLANQSNVSLPVPSISLQNPTATNNSASAFSLDTSALGTTIAAQSTTKFTVTFAPGQAEVESTTLIVGANSYPLQGAGETSPTVADVFSLVVSYIDPDKVTGHPQAATPIPFSTVPGTAGWPLTFTISNTDPSAANAVTVNAITVTGANFTLSGLPTLPVTVQLGASFTFTVTFAASASGTFTGTLSLDSRQFSLTGQAVVSSVPAISLQVSPQPLASQQQANVVVQFATPATAAAVGTISLAFTPAITNVTDDPAIVFVANNGRQLSLNVAAGAQQATYNGQSNITFQTGTTEGSIAFTVNFTNATPFTQTFTIPAATIDITSATAVRQSPNLVVTVNGYDNTYSASTMSFTFYDTSGNAIGSPVTVNETARFQQLFFNNNTAGGAFSLQASFPVNGDVTKVGSVGISMTNSSGQTSVNEVFQ